MVAIQWEKLIRLADRRKILGAYLSLLIVLFSASIHAQVRRVSGLQLV